jgi:beta-lactamase regulating signal transducer with metallopeptidase domain
MPSVILGLEMSGWHYFICHICFVGAPLWDVMLGAVLQVVMLGIALVAVGLGLVRLFLMSKIVTRYGLFTDPEIQIHADELGRNMQIGHVRVWLTCSQQPIAFTYGIFQPIVVLSTWMIEHLDQRELEAVLVHEMEHVARRDYLMVWLSMVLRDAFFYIPTCHIAYHQLQHEKEFACDDLAVLVTRRPLALASALAKVWQNAVVTSTFLTAFGAAQPLVGSKNVTHKRIEHLLSLSPFKISALTLHSKTLGTKVFALSVLFIVQCVDVVIMITLMGHNPLVFLEKML